MQQVRIARIRFRDDVDLMLVAEIDFPVDIDVGGTANAITQTRPDAGHLPELLGRRRECGRTRAKPLEQGAPCPRTNAGDQAQSQCVAQ